ncbi:hypothetical protein DSO57_1009563 [Entomophthora muscae]|uniref:Uncharacterized protein n=1 Tax=Entomophthora muscae TaxID=34485 RepID=A0ACC2RY14_9FUNG|nr:hypothetical protein DSO57_1009563 [Entomophthora muscae]
MELARVRSYLRKDVVAYLKSLATPHLLVMKASLLFQVAGLVYGQTDACANLATKEVVSYEQAMACYRSFPLTDSVRIGTVDTIRRVVEDFYVFADLVKDSAQAEERVDVLDNLKAISNTTYASEMDFQTSISLLFKKLHDGHTTYTPACFLRLVFKQPFPVYAYTDDSGQTHVRILDRSRIDDDYGLGWEDLDLNRYFGARVLRIDGIPATEYLDKFSRRNIGLSRDVSSSINFAMARIILKEGKWGFAYGEFATSTSPPEKGSLEFEVELKTGIESVKVPYLALVPENVRASRSYYRSFCKPRPQEIERASGYPEVEMTEMKVPAVLQVKLNSPLPVRRRRDMDPLQSPLVNGKHIKAYLVGRSTGVLVIPDFESPSLAWYDEVRTAFRQFQREGVTKLILDLSNNGGGVICRGYGLLRFLFPNSPYFDTDMRFSPLLGALTEEPAANFFPPTNFDRTDGSPFTRLDAFKEAGPRQNRASLHTPLFHDRCQSNFLASLITEVPPFAANDIAVVSNSICYSTCALLTSALQELHNVTTYAAGGLPQPSRPSLFSCWGHSLLL